MSQQRDESAPRTRRPERTCIACRKTGTRGELFRLVAAPDGSIVLDARAKMPGRGAWVHPTRGCITAAVKRHAAERALKTERTNQSPDEVIAGLAAALVRKAHSLLVTASRTRSIAIGATAVAESLERGRVRVVIVATDAGEVRAAVGDDAKTVRVFGTKQALGGIFGREEVAILAVLDAGIATELLSTLDCLTGLEDG